MFIGFGIAFAVKVIIEGMSILRATLSIPLTFFHKVAAFSTEMAPELVGVGYVIGVRVSAIMMAGAVIGNLVIVPTIATFGENVPVVIAPSNKLIKDMSLHDIQDNYLRFIGAGCVTAAGIISMMRTLPMIFRSFRSSLGSLRGAKSGSSKLRTDHDLPPSFVLFGSLGLLALLAGFLASELLGVGVQGAWWKAGLGAVLVLLFGFLFVTVSSRLTGEIGSSSNPISGMTVATLALTCLIFLGLGMTSPMESAIALSIGAVVCIAASNGGTTSQDLKTGYLVGGTPIYQQWAILIGALSSALVIGVILLVFNQAGTVYTKKDLPNHKLTTSQVAELKEKATYEGKEYAIWRPRDGDPSKVIPGKYYIEENGTIALLEDPAITGRITERDDGTEVKMKFKAPKTEVIGIIIKGVLESKLNWPLVLIGAALAVGLELCGVSSLAFAVGVYIPMQYSTPIFLGGLVRWIADKYTAPVVSPGKDEATAIAEAETGSGVLMASGYIAGGTLAGVLLAFVELPFFETVKKGIDFTVKDGDGKSGPALAYLYHGIDVAALPLLLGLLVFLALVGMGKILPTKPEGKGNPP